MRHELSTEPVSRSAQAGETAEPFAAIRGEAIGPLVSSHLGIAREGTGPPRGRRKDPVPESSTGGLTGDDVDDRVPEALQREDERSNVVETEVVRVRIGQSVDSIDAGGYPRDEEGNEEEESDSRVQPCLGIGLAFSNIAGQRSHAQGSWSDSWLVGVHMDVDRVRLDTRSTIVAAAASDGFKTSESIILDHRAFVGRNFNLRGDSADEGLLIEWVEETIEMLALVPDYLACHDIDAKSKDNGNPDAWLVKVVRRSMYNIPDNSIEESDSHPIPLGRNPTPNDGVAIHLALVFGGDEEEHHRRNQS
jgi:hypothetical protein